MATDVLPHNRALFSSQYKTYQDWSGRNVLLSKQRTLPCGLPLNCLVYVGHVVRRGLVLAGTGSGIGTKVLEVLQDGYPEVYR